MPTAADALALAEQGFRVLPLKAGTKIPALPDWPNKATTLAPTIRAWWQTWKDANIGIATGRGLLVIDVDVKGGGYESLAALERELGALPSTLSVHTPSGGAHRYYSVAQPVPNSVRALAPGIDIRGDGGQVAAPPSVGATNGYAWMDATTPMVPLPAAWLERLLAGSQPEQRASLPFTLEPGELIPEGQRDNTMFKLASSLRARGMSHAEILGALRATNETRCRPALSQADVERIARSASKFPRGEQPAEFRRSTRVQVTQPDEPATPREPLPRFPVHCLPGIAADIVMAAAESVGVPEDMVAVPALVAMAASIGASRCLAVDDDWTVHASLWGAVVAPPSAGKSPAMRLVMRPLRERHKALLREHRAAMEKYRSELEDWQGTKATQRDERPVVPTGSRVIVNDFTSEALAKILNDNPRGVLVDKDELAGWVRSMNQYKGGKGSDRTFALEVWASETSTVDRRHTEEPLFVELPVVSVIGGIQPDVLGELRERDDGFLERFLYTVQPDAPALRYSDRTAPDHIKAAWSTLVTRLLSLEMAPGLYGPVPRAMRFTRQGKDAFVAGLDRLADATDDPDLQPHLKSAYGKFNAYAARLALVIHCGLQCSGEAGEDIDARTAEKAWLLADYFKAHARAAQGAISTNETDRHVDRLESWLRKRGGRATTRDATKAQVAGARTKEEVLVLAQRMVDRGIGRVETTGQKTELVLV